MQKFLTTMVLGVGLLLVPFSFSSCDKVGDLLSPIDIFMKSKDIPITIPATAAGQRQAFASITVDLQAEIDRHNTSGYPLKVENIESAYIKGASIEIVGGASPTNNFANFTEGGLYFGTNANANTSAQLLFAHVLNNPDVYSVKLDFPPQGSTNLKDHIKGTVFDYLYAYTLRRAITVPLNAIIRVEYDIKIKP